MFPVEINRAPYADLLRVPGIGVKSARRILSARRSTKLTFQDLKKLGVVMKRAVYFITCGGRMMYPHEAGGGLYRAESDGSEGTDPVRQRWHELPADDLV